jgi:hypothetical protein
MPEFDFLKSGDWMLVSLIAVAIAGIRLWADLLKMWKESQREAFERARLELEVAQLKAEGYAPPRNEQGRQAEARARAPAAKTTDANAESAVISRWADAHERRRRATQRAALLSAVLLLGFFVLGFALGGLR